MLWGISTLDPGLEPQQCLYMCKYVHRNGLAAIQCAKRWIHGIQARESTLALKPRQTSTEVQNSSTGDSTKRTDIVHNFFKKMIVF